MAWHREYMAAQYHRFCHCTSVEHLAALLGITPLRLYQLRFEPSYHVFEVKKQNGKTRLIEAPQNELKALLHRLSNFLQCSYFFNRTASAYGFVQQPRGVNKKKNILANAKLHCGKKFMMNIDLENFFHQISKIRVVKSFRSPPFSFSTELSSFLAEITTYKNRLPMGSPTSPALSNWCSMEMDKDLERFARERSLTYSRYVDDLTFSANHPINADVFYGTREILTKHSLRINWHKMALMGEHDPKIVTGLLLTDRPHVTAGFLHDLEKNLHRLKHILEFTSITPEKAATGWIEHFNEHLKGKMHFLQMVYGHKSPVYEKMNRLYYDAFDTKTYMESFTWKRYPYF